MNHDESEFMTPAAFVGHVRAQLDRLGLADESITLKVVRWRGADAWVARCWKAKGRGETAEGAMRSLLNALFDLANHDAEAAQ